MRDAGWVAEAAAVLLRHERAGTRLDTLPPALRPQTLAEGYAVQDAFAAAWGAPVAGWKNAATSPGGRKMLGVEGPLSGRLFADRLHHPGAVVPLSPTAMGVVEVELAFTFGMPLAPQSRPWDRAEVLASVATLHLAVELPETRWQRVAEVGMPQVAADNACGGRVVLGSALPDSAWRGHDLSSVHARIGLEDAAPAEGRGANVMGDPLEALTWLVHSVTGRGLSVAAGAVLITGSLTPPPALRNGAQVLADVRELGKLGFTVG